MRKCPTDVWVGTLFAVPAEAISNKRFDLRLPGGTVLHDCLYVKGKWIHGGEEVLHVVEWRLGAYQEMEE